VEVETLETYLLVATAALVLLFFVTLPYTQSQAVQV
jgi:hypothetical protein